MQRLEEFRCPGNEVSYVQSCCSGCMVPIVSERPINQQHTHKKRVFIATTQESNRPTDFIISML
jgi:hypothetical protein